LVGFDSEGVCGGVTEYLVTDGVTYLRGEWIELNWCKIGLECVWIDYFNEIIFFLKNLDFFVINCFVWIEKLKNVSNASIFLKDFN